MMGSVTLQTRLCTKQRFTSAGQGLEKNFKDFTPCKQHTEGKVEESARSGVRPASTFNRPVALTSWEEISPRWGLGPGGKREGE